MATEIERAIIELQVLFRNIDQRLAAIEKKPGSTTPGSTPPTTSPTSTPPSSPDTRYPPMAPFVERTGSPADPYEVTPPPATPTPPPYSARPTDTPHTTPTFTSPAAQAAATASQRLQSLFQQIAERPKPPDDAFEKTIGQSVVSHVGGLILLGGILFFLRNSFDIPWLLPSTRILTAAITGLLLTILGQWLHILRMRPLAAAITATGLATLMSTFFAGHIAYDPIILSRTTAYIGILLTGAAGIALAFQMRLQSLAILSLLGMYLAPLILTSTTRDPTSLLIYLSTITLAALTIAFFRRHWYFLRGLALFAFLIPLYFDQFHISIAWSILALALALYSLLAHSRNARIAMFITYCLLGLHILIFDSANDAFRDTLFSFAGTNFTHLMARGAIAALEALLLAWLVRPPRFPESAAPSDPRGDFYATVWAPTCLALAGSIVWCVTAGIAIHNQQHLTFTFLAWTFALTTLGRFLFNDDDAPFIEINAAILLTITTLKWITLDGFAPVTTGALDSTTQLLPGFNLFLLNGLLILLAFKTTRILNFLGSQFFGWLITTLAFIALNVEALRTIDNLPTANITLLGEPWFVKNILLSLLWGLYAFGMVCTGFLRKYSPARWVALCLMALTVVKVLLIDMDRVDTGLRVLSFISIGALLLIISFLYHRTPAKPLSPSVP